MNTYAVHSNPLWTSPIGTREPADFSHEKGLFMYVDPVTGIVYYFSALTLVQLLVSNEVLPSYLSVPDGMRTDNLEDAIRKMQKQHK